MPPSYPSGKQFRVTFHIVSKRVLAGLCPVTHNTHLNCCPSHLSCLNTPLSGFPLTLTTFIQIIESGSAFMVTHTKVEILFSEKPDWTMCISEELFELRNTTGPTRTELYQTPAWVLPLTVSLVPMLVS